MDSEENNRGELKEKDFIQEGYTKNPLPFWIWTAILFAILALAWGFKGWMNSKPGAGGYGPFSQVTNREFSLFLWENPEKMRGQSKEKAIYLTGFELPPRINIKEGQADYYVVAPPSIVHHYHVWNRLLGDKIFVRPIPPDEFQRFLAQLPEWQPDNWAEAPEGYTVFFDKFEAGEELPNDLATLNEEELPRIVRKAFYGWKNFFLEGAEINQTVPSYPMMEQFLQQNPEYQRTLWINVLEDSYPKYLKSVSGGSGKRDEHIPMDELAPFLRAGYYNYLQSLKNPQ